MTTMRTEFWHGHNLCEELAIALTEIEGHEALVAGAEFKPGFWNLYLILKSAAKEGFAVTQHVVAGADLFEVWCPATDENAGPMDANGVASFMQGFAVSQLRYLQKGGDTDASK